MMLLALAIIPLLVAPLDKRQSLEMDEETAERIAKLQGLLEIRDRLSTKEKESDDSTTEKKSHFE
jgi:hypothetical protein